MIIKEVVWGALSNKKYTGHAGCSPNFDVTGDCLELLFWCGIIRNPVQPGAYEGTRLTWVPHGYASEFKDDQRVLGFGGLAFWSALAKLAIAIGAHLGLQPLWLTLSGLPCWCDRECPFLASGRNRKGLNANHNIFPHSLRPSKLSTSLVRFPVLLFSHLGVAQN